MNVPKSADEPVSIMPPSSVSLVFSLGSARPALISLLSLSMTSAGVFFGADAVPGARLVTRHGIANAWQLRQRLRAGRGRDRQWSQLAGFDVSDGGRHGVEGDLHLSAEQIGEHRARAAIGHVRSGKTTA